MFCFSQVPEDMLSKCRLSYIELGDPVSIEELGKRTQDPGTSNYTGYIESCIQGLLKVRAVFLHYIYFYMIGNIIKRKI